VAAVEKVFCELRINYFKTELDALNGSCDRNILFDISKPQEKEIWNRVFSSAEDKKSSVIESVLFDRVLLSRLIELSINEITEQRGREISRGIEKN
jgi:hypothetical protein